MKFSIDIWEGWNVVHSDSSWLPSSPIKVTPNNPPTFMVMTQNDVLGVEGVLHYYLALQQAKVPSELHLYPTGGHGYGLCRSEHYVATWPDRATDWPRSRKLLERSSN